MKDAEKRKAVVIEEYELRVEVKPEEIIITVCATCNRVIYSSTKIDPVTVRVADQVCVAHGSAFNPKHDVVMITFDHTN